MPDGLRSTLALCRWNARGIGTRLRGAIVVTAGFFAVVVVFVAVLSVRDGITRSGIRPGSDRIATVYGNRGALDAASLNIIGQAAGVARDGNGPAIAGIQSGAMILHDWKPDMLGLAVVMGIDANRVGTLPNFHVMKGRLFQSGHDEMLIGEGATRLYPEYGIGRSVEWLHHSWKIVGIYSTGSSVQDSQFLADVRQMHAATKANNTFDSTYVELTSPAAFDDFKKSLAHQRGLDVKVERLSDDDRNYGDDLKAILVLIDSVITVLMAAGAIFAGLNVMYANVARRGPELALLRALGFSRLPVLAAVLSEAMLLAVVGGVAGVVAAVFVFNGLETGTLAGGHPVSFRFAVTPQAAAIALLLTLGMGFLGGLFPAIRAVRRSISAGLREE